MQHMKHNTCNVEKLERLIVWNGGGVFFLKKNVATPFHLIWMEMRWTMIFASYILNVQCERGGSEKQKDGAIRNTVHYRRLCIYRVL